jgi:hypothetical protein
VTDQPYCVEPGWDRADDIANPDGPAYRLLHWTRGASPGVGFEHLCDRGDRGQITCAPRLDPAGHQVTMVVCGDGQTRPTVTPSILCEDCDTHGFVTAGAWAGT